MHFMYSSRVSTSFVNHPLTNVGVAAAGGVCVCLFMTKFLRNVLERRTIGQLSVVCYAGLLGIVSTVLALEGFYVLASAYLAFVLGSQLHPTFLQRLGMFVVWFIDIQVFGLRPIGLILPFSFLYGLVAGIAIVQAGKRQARNVSL